MRKRNFTLRMSCVALAIGSMMSLSACDKDDDNDMNSDKTITEIVSNSSSFSSLESAVIKANMGATLSGAGPFTVFAPDNEAFASAGVTAEMIQSMSADELEDILLYHTIGGKIEASAIATGNNTAVKTALGTDVYVTKNSSGVYVNGWKVKQADMEARNGVIHTLSGVLMPAKDNIVEMAQDNPNMTFLVAAVVTASLGNTDIAALLSGNGSYTIFAPTNQAFIDAGFATIASIQAANPNTLAEILKYHVVPMRAFSSDLTNNMTLETAQGGDLMVSVNTNATIKGSGNTTAANITMMNKLATNGVVHVIDKVLMPAM